jgi:hypothetical protein
MAQVDPGWSLDAAVLQDYHSHAGWRAWFTEAYSKAIELADPEEVLSGWRTAAVIFGDMPNPSQTCANGMRKPR